MYSLLISYTEIKPVRPALTSFAAQIIATRLEAEAEEAIKPENGLCVALSHKKHAAKKISWTDIGAATVERARKIIQALQPLTWALLMKVAARPGRKVNGVRAVRKNRPPEIVSTLTRPLCLCTDNSNTRSRLE